MSIKTDYVLPLIKKKNASNSVAEEIEKLIVQHLVKPGDKLPSERELTERFGVGRYTVREGLAILQARGIIHVYPGKGAFINENATDALKSMLADLFLKEEASLEGMLETRCVIESTAAFLAARRATDEEIHVLEEQLALIKIAGSSNVDSEPENSESTKQQIELNEVDEEFHFLIAQATHNRSFECIVRGVIQAAKLEVRKNIFTLSQMLNSIEEGINSIYTQEFYRKNYSYHEKIFEAIKGHKQQDAYKAMQEHLSEGILVRYLEKKLKAKQMEGRQE